MAILPNDNRLKIEQMIEDKVVQGEMRGYLGLSGIGKECPRSIWYDFRFASKKELSARIDRLFSRGHREEPIIIADLERVGVKVFNPTECREMGYPVVEMENGEEQVEVVTGYGHIKGHGDGLGIGIPDAPKTMHYLEFKTMAEKYFNSLKKKGIEEAQPVYYAQCQTMMRLLKVTRTLFIAVNKNTDERYYERLRLDNKEADNLIKRGTDIILTEIPSNRNKTFKCNWCDHEGICFEQVEPLRNCRTCQYCDMEDEGKWSCSEKEKNGKKQWLPHEVQVVGCRDWRKLKTL